MNIESIHAYEIYNALGIPTIACTIVLDSGACVTATIPSGTSVSAYEAKELRDQDRRLFGMGVRKAIDNIESIIAPILIGQPPTVVEMDLKMIELDGTDNKSRLGSNATLAVSIALLKAQALVEGLEVYEMIAHLCEYERVSLPFATFNLIGGSKHAYNKVSIQEFMVMPVGAESFRASMEIVAQVFYACKELLQQQNIFFGIDDEGGYAVPFEHEREVLDFIMQAIDNIGMRQQIVLALDIAATQLYNEQTQTYMLSGQEYTTNELIAYYDQLGSDYPIYSIEDGLAASDWQGWQRMTTCLGSKIQIAGDDLFATNAARIVYGIEQGAANAVIIKPNQVGTVTETLQAIKLCKEYDMNAIASHCLGDTCDPFIVDVAVGTSSGQIKSGGLMRGEYVAKYNYLLRIEDELMGSLLGSL